MAANPIPIYQKLPGTGHRRVIPDWGMLLASFVVGFLAVLIRGPRVQLWLADDHLLLVENDGYKEHYKRFRYADIQAVILRKSTEGKITNCIAGGAAAFFGALGALVFLGADEPGLGSFFMAVGLLYLLVLVIYAAKGPICECRLQTAVLVEELPSLLRLRQAEKALPLLRARIAAVQGEWPPTTLGGLMPEPVTSANPTPTPAAVSVSPPEEPNSPPQNPAP